MLTCDGNYVCPHCLRVVNSRCEVTISSDWKWCTGVDRNVPCHPLCAAVDIVIELLQVMHHCLGVAGKSFHPMYSADMSSYSRWCLPQASAGISYQEVKIDIR